MSTSSTQHSIRNVIIMRRLMLVDQLNFIIFSVRLRRKITGEMNGKSMKITNTATNIAKLKQ